MYCLNLLSNTVMRTAEHGGLSFPVRIGQLDKRPERRLLADCGRRPDDRVRPKTAAELKLHLTR